MDTKSLIIDIAITQESTNVMLSKLIINIEMKGTLTGYIFSSIVSEIAYSIALKMTASIEGGIMLCLTEKNN